MSHWKRLHLFHGGNVSGNSHNVWNVMEKLCPLEELDPSDRWWTVKLFSTSINHGREAGSAVTLSHRNTCIYWVSRSPVNKVEEILLRCFLDTFFPHSNRLVFSALLLNLLNMMISQGSFPEHREILGSCYLNLERA